MWKDLTSESYDEIMKCETVVLYKPSLDRRVPGYQEDWPGHSITISNPTFAAQSGHEQGYTQWMPIDLPVV